jgi:hypothetical protein
LEGVEAEFKSFYEYSSPSENEKLEHQFTLPLDSFANVDGLGMCTFRVTVSQKNKIAIVKPQTPLKRFLKVLHSDTEDSAALLTAYEELHSSHSTEKYVGFMKDSELSFQSMKGPEWLFQEQWFLKLKESLKLKLFRTLLWGTLNPNLDKNPILIAINQREFQLVAFLLKQPTIKKNERDLDQNNIIHCIFEALQRSRTCSCTRLLLECISHCKGEAQLFKQRNSKGDTPLLTMIKYYGFSNQMKYAISMRGNEMVTMLYDVIKGYATAELLIALDSIIPRYRLQKWQTYGFEASTLKIVLLTLLYKGLIIKFKGRLGKVLMRETISGFLGTC